MNLRINQLAKNDLSFGNTFCIIKPEKFSERNHIIEDYIEPEGFKVVKKWEGVAPKDVLERHYDNISDKPFFPNVIDYMSSDKICIMELDGGEDDVKRFRDFALNTLRPIFGTDKTHNGIHASDSEESANREINEIWGKYLNLNV